MITNREHLFANRTKGMKSSAIREILKLTQEPDIISFAGGLPAPEVFPVKEFQSACDFVLSEVGAQALQYSTTEGYVPLREYIKDELTSPGYKLNLENIIITSGSQQALDLVGKVFINPGDKILVESPTYVGALQAWNAYEAEYLTVPMDDQGMLLAPLEDALRQGPKFVYVLPNFQNPTGVSWSLDRRRELVRLADQYGVPIFEDDPYRKLRFNGVDIPSNLLLDIQFRNQVAGPYTGNVIYTSTFSKTLAPGIRMAWMIASPDVIAKLVQAKQGADLHTSTFNQMVVYEVARSGFLERHAEVIRSTYGERRKTMLESMNIHFPPGVAWTIPDGGMFLWVTLPEGIRSEDVFHQAVEQKVAFVPGGPFHATGGGENTMRLNFSNASPKLIREGIYRLGKVIETEFLSAKI